MRNGIERAMGLVYALVMFLVAGIGATSALAAEPRLDALKQACAAGDPKEIHRAAGELASAWKGAPDYAAIDEAVRDRSADPTFRWVMIDSLVRYKRSAKNDRDAAALLSLLDSVSWAGDEWPAVRAKSITVQAGMIALYGEQGFISAARRREFGKKLAAVIGTEKNGELVAAACIAAGSAGAAEAVPALRKQVRNENAPSLVRRTAAGSLGRLKDRESISLLSEVMGKTADRELYGSSAFALGTMGGEEIVEPLVKHSGRFETHSCGNALKRNSATVTRMLADTRSPGLENAVRAAGLAGMKESIPQLEALEKDARPEVRRAAIETRNTLGRQAGGPPPGGNSRWEVKP
jgi:HEAT repeat protein